MNRYLSALSIALSLASSSAFATPVGSCEVGVRMKDVQVDEIFLAMNRSEDCHWFAGDILGIRLSLTVVEKKDGLLQISATDAKSGKDLITPASLKFHNDEVRTQVISGDTILDITCH